MGILYRSRSPKSDIVITDFGLAKYLKNPTSQAMTSVCGTPLYAAPEILTGEPYGPEVDLWSVGVILYILLCGAPPFQEKTKGGRSLYTQITRGKFILTILFGKNLPSSKGHCQWTVK